MIQNIQTTSSDFNVEFAHLYVDELERGNFKVLHPAILATRSVLESLVSQGATYSVCILIDNYGFEHLGRNVEGLRQYMKEQGIPVHHIAYEGDLHRVGEDLIGALRTRAVYRTSGEIGLNSPNEDRHLEHLFTPPVSPKARLLGRKQTVSILQQFRERFQTRVPLAHESEGQAKYGCALLAACWTLARLGYDPYRSAVKLNSCEGAPAFVGNRLITVLPMKYLKVEGTVYELLGELQSRTLRSAAKRIRYVFHGDDVL